MYGYVRPLKPELKIREFERYQAVYCGLCHALAKRFGLLARFCVNYDMTLPILLASDSAPTVCRKRCIAHPLKKRCVICASPVLDRAADMTMILAYHKLSDTVADSRGFKRLGARIGRFSSAAAIKRPPHAKRNLMRSSAKILPGSPNSKRR